jgi:aspartyl/glutamyl-tRNA(Asn/Gln) amidotransferase C subunit
LFLAVISFYLTINYKNCLIIVRGKRTLGDGMEKHIIDLDTIEHLADLSGLNFTEKEKDTMVKEVRGIITMLENCEDVELTEKSKPKTIGLLDLREDKVMPSMKKDKAIGQAINTQSDYIVIPKVVD